MVHWKCVACGSDLVGRKAGTKYCSKWCGSTYYAASGRFDQRFGRCCERCGADMPGSARLNARFCSEPCQASANQEVRRARRRLLPVERISRRVIFERDGWTCHICGKETCRDLGREPESPSLDHLIPLSRADSPGHVWENVATAHLGCNFSKNARVAAADRALHDRLRLQRLGVVVR